MIVKNRKVLHENYTVVPNGFLRDPTLSLKAKGLLCLLISLPDDWCASVAGLTRMSRDSKSSIRAAVSELECAGLITRESRRLVSGRFTSFDYVLSELLYTKGTSPFTDFPTTEKPTTEKPMTENQTLQSKDIQNKEEQSKDLQRVHGRTRDKRERNRGRVARGDTADEYLLYNSDTEVNAGYDDGV